WLCFRFSTFESLPKNMSESPKLVHQKGDPYRAKGECLRYCSNAIFQGFAAEKTRAVFSRKLAPQRPLGRARLATAINRANAGEAVWTAGPTDAGRHLGSRESAAESGGAQRAQVPCDPNPGVAAQAPRSDFGRWHQRVIPAS